MKQSYLLTLLILILTAVQSATAQNEVKLRDIECYNLGDGRYFCRDKETKKPLQGSSRIIDGYTSQYTEATFKDGIPNGSWKVYKYKKLAEERTYKNGELDGPYKEYYTDGGTVKTSCTYVNGKKDGKLLQYYNDGKIEIEAEYKDGKRNGWERKYNYDDGSLKSEVFYKDDEVSSDTGSGGPVKQTKQITSNQGNYVQTFYAINGKYEGEYTEQWMEGAKAMKAKGQYKDGKKTGLWVYEDVSGKKESEENYLNGELDGTFILYQCINGNKSQVREYTKGKLNGTSRSYSCKTGNVTSESTYVDGVQKSIKSYDDNGKLIYEQGVK